MLDKYSDNKTDQEFNPQKMTYTQLFRTSAADALLDRVFIHARMHTKGYFLHNKVPGCEPFWPSGKALGWPAEGPQLDPASALLSLKKITVYGLSLGTLSLTIRETLKMALITAHLNAGVTLVVTV